MRGIPGVPIFDGEYVDIKLFDKERIVRRVNKKVLNEVNVCISGYFLSYLAVTVLKEIRASCQTTRRRDKLPFLENRTK